MRKNLNQYLMSLSESEIKINRAFRAVRKLALSHSQLAITTQQARIRISDSMKTMSMANVGGTVTKTNQGT